MAVGLVVGAAVVLAVAVGMPAEDVAVDGLTVPQPASNNAQKMRKGGKIPRFMDKLLCQRVVISAVGRLTLSQ